MEPQPLARAQGRIAESRRQADPAALTTTVERARAALEALAERTAELEAAIPERLGTAVHESMRAEVLPVGRQVAEIRGLSNQTIRRLEGLRGDLDTEREARVEDLAVLVDLIASGWRGLDRRLDRLERSLERRPAAGLYGLDERQERSAESA